MKRGRTSTCSLDIVIERRASFSDTEMIEVDRHDDGYFLSFWSYKIVKNVFARDARARERTEAEEEERRGGEGGTPTRRTRRRMSRNKSLPRDVVPTVHHVTISRARSCKFAPLPSSTPPVTTIGIPEYFGQIAVQKFVLPCALQSCVTASSSRI